MIAKSASAPEAPMGFVPPPGAAPRGSVARAPDRGPAPWRGSRGPRIERTGAAGGRGGKRHRIRERRWGIIPPVRDPYETPVPPPERLGRRAVRASPPCLRPPAGGTLMSRILVVDDDPIVARTLVDLLALHDYDALKAA